MRTQYIMRRSKRLGVTFARRRRPSAEQMHSRGIIESVIPKWSSRASIANAEAVARLSVTAMTVQDNTSLFREHVRIV
jgi:hypothetical protein